MDLFKHGCRLQVIPPLLHLSCLSSSCLARPADLQRVQALTTSTSRLLQACSICLGPISSPSLWQLRCCRPWLLRPSGLHLLLVSPCPKPLSRAASLQLVHLRRLEEGTLSRPCACLAKPRRWLAACCSCCCLVGLSQHGCLLPSRLRGLRRLAAPAGRSRFPASVVGYVPSVDDWMRGRQHCSVRVQERSRTPVKPFCERQVGGPLVGCWPLLLALWHAEVWPSAGLQIWADGLPATWSQQAAVLPAAS